MANENVTDCCTPYTPPLPSAQHTFGWQMEICVKMSVNVSEKIWLVWVRLELLWLPFMQQELREGGREKERKRKIERKSQFDHSISYGCLTTKQEFYNILNNLYLPYPLTFLLLLPILMYSFLFSFTLHIFNSVYAIFIVFLFVSSSQTWHELLFPLTSASKA